jgi:hypothetical protein
MASLHLLQQRKFLLTTRLQLGLPFILILAHGVCYRTCHQEIPMPLMVCWHDIPGSFMSTALGQSILIGRLIFAPILALGPIGSREFPGFGFLLPVGEQAAFLLVTVNMQKELQKIIGQTRPLLLHFKAMTRRAE